MYGMGDFLQISNPAGDFFKRVSRAYKRACKKGHNKLTWQQAIKAFKSGRLQADGTLRKSKKKTTKKRAARKSSRRKTTRRKSARKTTRRKTGKRRSSKRKSRR